ncbi:hypothetical protein [Amphibacillus sediminis]|uniref:hypothetical protein n=1 Tax=Amphibacillus sediminis TaxID=360185 RepID=UPI000835D88A|nr:hypothetical protein [Amphibacillus sediminis]
MLRILYLLSLALLLTSCNSSNSSEFDELTYTKVNEEIENLEEEENPVFDMLTIEQTYYQIEDEGDDFERRLEIEFIIKNITDKEVTMKYIGFFPDELEQYYLSRNSLIGDEYPLKSNQEWRHSASMLVQYPENLPDDAKEYLESEGEKIYFAFEIDEELYYLEFDLDDEMKASD